MPFDPNQPYEVVDQSTPKVQFDPSQPFEVISEKGGELNEDEITSQPEANSDRNAGRKANQQVAPVRSEANVQANVQLRPKDKGQRQRNDQADLKDNRITEGGELNAKQKDAKAKDGDGSQVRQEDGQGVRIQEDAREQAQVTDESGSVPPAPEKSFAQKSFEAARDFGAEALSSIGQSIYGALGGIARTEPEYIELPSYGTKVKNPRYQESKDLVDFFERQKAGAADVEALGAKPLTGVAKTAADVTGGLLKLPAQAFTGPLGMASMIGEAFGSHKDAVYQKAKSEGLSDEEALNKADFEATASTAAALPLYYVGGKVAGAAADKILSESAPKLVKVATRVGLNAVANSVASAASRGVTAALEGENIVDAMKDVDVPGVIQDIAFAAHSTATHFQEQVAKGNGKEAARDLPDHALEQFAQDPNYADVVAPEVKARAESRMAQQAEQTNLPDTAKVLEVSSEAERIATPEPPRFEEAPAKTITLEPITPEAPPLAEGEAAPSLPKEETQPPVSVAGEAPAVEQVVEKPSPEKIKQATEAVSSLEKNNQDIERKTVFDPPASPTLQDARFADDKIAKKGHSLTISGGSQEGTILDPQKAKQKFDNIGYARQEIQLPDDFNNFVSEKYGSSISNIKATKSPSWLGAHFNGGVAINESLPLQQRGRVVAHELGHASHSLLGDAINKNQNVLNEIVKIEEYLYPNLRDTIKSAQNPDAKFFNYLLSPDEIIAEFNVERIANPEKAKEIAPELSSLLESIEKDKNLVKDRKVFPTSFGTYKETKSRLKVDSLEHRKIEEPSETTMATWIKELKRNLQAGLKSYSSASVSLLKQKNASPETIRKIVEDYANDEQYDLIKQQHPDLFEQPAEAPAEAQPTKPSETKVKETGGLLTEQGITPVAETAVKAKEGVAPREGEGKEEVAVPEGARVAAAAYLAPDGNTYEGSSHLDAMEKAKEAGVITQAEIDAKQTPESRNTEEFGYAITLPDGTRTTTTRETGGQIAKASGQALKDQFDFGDKMHSNETRLDEYNASGERRVSPQKFAQDPKAAVQEVIPDPTEEVLQKNQMTRPDAQALGITPKGTAQTNFLIDSVKSKVEELGDAIKYRGKNIKDLRKVGVEDEANQHASARIYVPVHVEELLGRVFGETKDIEKMRPTMDILVKDDIVGGYEDIVKQVNDLEAEKAQAQAEGRPTKAIENRIETLSKRGRDIEEAHPIEKYKQEIENASPEIQGNIERWKRHVVPEMDSLYNELKNVDPATEREGRGWKFGARLNLLSKTEEEKMASYGDLDKPMPSTSVSNYRNPNVKRDKFMQKASFLGDYSTDPVAILTNSLASRWNEVTKIRFYKALEDKGVGKIVAAGEEAPTMIGGKEAVRLPIKFPETDPKTGITRVVEQSLYVQKGLEDSVKKVLDVDSKPKQLFFTKPFTRIQIIGFADATAHLKNLQNVVRNALGRESSWADITAKIPILGQAQSVKEIADVAKEVASKSQRTRDEKAYLAKIGALRPFYPAEGLQRFLGTHQLLHDVDTATRIILNRRYDELIKRYGAVDTESARRDFINQVGNYNRRLMGYWETKARDTGFSPFIVAGRAMNRYARKMITGDPGFQTDNVKGAIAARAAQISSLAFATLIPAITNMFTTGNPYGREGTPIGAIDFGPNYDTEEGKRRTFDVFALTGLRRGLRQFGIDSAIDGARSGKDIRDIERDMANGFITTKMHPWIGPAVGLGQETLTGKRFDLRTGYSQRYEARKIDDTLGQYAENFRIALKQLNPLLYGVAGKGVEWAMKDIGGIPYPSEERVSKENLGLISKAVGFPQVVGEIEGALEKPVLGAVGYKESPSEAIKLANSFGEAVQFTPEQDQRFTYRRQIKDALAKGDKNTARDLYQQGFNDGILTEADKKSIGRYMKYPDKVVQKFQMLKTADQAVRAWRVATSKEQDAVGEIVAKKIANSTTIIKGSPQEKKLIDTFLNSAKPNTEVYEIAKRRKKQ
jgi:hypothetical protein